MGAAAPPPRPGSPRAGGRGVSGAHRAQHPAQLGPSGAAWSTDAAGRSPEPRGGGGGGGDVGQRRILSCPRHDQRQVAAPRACPGRCRREEGRAAAAGARAVPELSETPAGAGVLRARMRVSGRPQPGAMRCAAQEPAARCPASPGPGRNGTAEGTRSPRGCLVTSTDPTIRRAAPGDKAARAWSSPSSPFLPSPLHPQNKRLGSRWGGGCRGMSGSEVKSS